MTGLLLLAGCHATREPMVLSWSWEARATAGEVRVAPALALHEPVGPELGSFVGRALSERQEKLRRARSADVERVPAEVGLALPGEVNGELGNAWPAQFSRGHLPRGSRSRLAEALRSGWDPDEALGQGARAMGGDAALFTWVDELSAEPLSLSNWPGDVVETPAGPLVVDERDEPFLLRAGVGMALVAADGEVVLRYHDTFETVLSATRGPEVAGRDLAHAMAAEVALVWVMDPRLRSVRSETEEGALASSEADGR